MNRRNERNQDGSSSPANHPTERAEPVLDKSTQPLSDVEDQIACDDALPEIERILDDPNTKWIRYDETTDAMLAEWAKRGRKSRNAGG